MESLKYCLVLATVISYVVANPTLVTLSFNKTTTSVIVEGTVSILDETTLKIQDYNNPGE